MIQVSQVEVKDWRNQMIRFKHLLILALSIGYPFLVSAQKTPKSVQHYSCRNEVSAGLNWEGSRWVTSSFKPKGGFFLTVAKFEDNIELQVRSDADLRFCRTGYNIEGYFAAMVASYSCANHLGEVITFSEKNLRGATAILLGSTSDDRNERDSLAIMPYICVPTP